MSSEEEAQKRTTTLVVGTFVGEKKNKKDFMKAAQGHTVDTRWQLQWVELSREIPLAQQPDVDVVVHKLTQELVIEARLHNGEAYGDMLKHAVETKQVLDDVRASQRPVLDPLDAVASVIDRRVLYEKLAQIELAYTEVPKVANAYTLQELEDEVEAQSLSYPVVIKTWDACSLSAAHEMAIVRTRAGMRALLEAASEHAAWKNVRGFTAQPFVNHRGVIHKVYSVDDQVEVQARESFADLAPTTNDEKEEEDSTNGRDSFVLFHSHDPVPEGWASGYGTDEQRVAEETAALDGMQEAAEEVCREIQRVFGLTMFGVDVLVDARTGKWMLVDLNYFPGYKNIQQRLADALVRMIVQAHEKAIDEESG